MKDKKGIVDTTVQGVMQQLQGAICESMSQIRGDTTGPSSQKIVTSVLIHPTNLDSEDRQANNHQGKALLWSGLALRLKNWQSTLVLVTVSFTGSCM